MNNMSDTISVIVPVYNGALYIKDALESIVRQGYSPLEVIIVDDGSTDNTKEIIEDFKGLNIRYLFQQQQGPAAARNRGLQIASGNLIAFLDADDIWPDYKIQNHLSILINNPQIDVIYGRLQFMVISAENKFTPSGEPTTGVNLGCTFSRRHVFDKIGYFDESLAASEDLDWLMRIKEHNIPMISIPEVSLFYRIHHTNMSRDKSRREAFFLQAIKKSFDRRKSNGASA